MSFMQGTLGWGFGLAFNRLMFQSHLSCPTPAMPLPCHMSRLLLDSSKKPAMRQALSVVEGLQTYYKPLK